MFGVVHTAMNGVYKVTTLKACGAQVCESVQSSYLGPVPTQKRAQIPLLAGGFGYVTE
jgi:hypothetical protein